MPAYDIGPRIGIEGEREFNNAIKAIDSQVRALTNEIKTLSKEYDANDSSLEGVTKKQNALNQAIETSRKRIELLTSQYEKQVAELKKLEDALEQARRENGEGSTEAIRAESALAKQAKTVNDLGSRLERAKGQLITFENQLRDLGNTATRAGDLLQTAGNKISSIGGAISGVGNALTVGVTTPILAAATAAVTMGNDFETQMSRVQAIAEATGDEFQALQEQALQLGADTSYSATEVAQGMENLASAGFTVDEIMVSMSGMLDLAASSGADLATASEIAASALRGFGLDASESSHVADVFAEAAARTNAQVEDMGEAMTYIAPVANAMGQSLEETAAAVGIMSDAGIKGSQAGTALRGALSRLAQPTSAMQETMEGLGISFYDTQGQMLPLSDMIETLEGSMAGLDDETRNNALVTLFGQEALPGVLALLERGSDDLRTLTASFQGADGAAAEMAETMMDNTAGSIEEMTGALETAGITVQQVLAPHIRSAAEYVTDLADQFSDLDEEQQKNIVAWAGIAAAAGPAVKILGTATSGVGKLTKGVGTVVSDLGKLVQSGGKATDSMSAFGKVLGTLGPKGLLVGVAIAGVTAIAGAVIKARDDIAQAEIDEAFGDIKLSAEEVEDVAQRLTTTEWTMKLDAAIDAKNQVDEFEQEMTSTLEELNKLNWKMSVGLELTEEEKSSYLSNVESFTQSASDYISQQGYSIALALDVAVGGTTVGENLSSFSSAFFADAQGQLEELGAQLAEKVNSAFENDTFAEDRMDIQQIIQQMNDVLSEIQNYEARARLDNLEIELETSGIGIDADSFNKINEAAQEALQETIDSGEELRIEATQSALIQYDMLVDAGVSEETAKKIYEDSKSQIEASLRQSMGETINVPLKFGFDTLAQNFDTEISGALAQMQPMIQDFVGTLVEAYESGNMDISAVVGQFEQDLPQLTGGARKAVEEYLSSIAPTVEDMKAIRDQCIADGQEVPQSITEGLSNVALLEAMVGQDGVGGVMALLGGAISDSPESLEALMACERFGESIPQELADAISLYSGYVYDANEDMWVQFSGDTDDLAQQVADELNAHGESLDEALAQGIAEQYGLVYENGKWMVSRSAQGVTDNTNTFVNAAKIVAQTGVSAMDQTTRGSNVGAPAMNTPNWTSAARSGRNSMQNYLWSNPLTIAVNATMSGVYAGINAARQAVRGYAVGGIVESPEIAMVGEAGDEAIIPLENNRARALDLWRQAGERLNAFAADQGRAVGAARREVLAQTSNDNHREINFGEGSIVIQTQATNGDAIYRQMMIRMQHEVKRKEVSYGPA